MSNEANQHLEAQPVNPSNDEVHKLAEAAVIGAGAELPDGLKRGDSVVVPFSDQLVGDPDSYVPAHVVGRPKGSESKVIVLPTGPFLNGYPHGTLQLTTKTVRQDQVTPRSRFDTTPKG